MQALLTARRTKAGQEDAFRKQWRSGKQPEGMRDAFLLEDEEDPRETLGIGLWDRPEQLRAYRASDAATQREKQLRSLVDTTRWQRPFAAFGVADITAGGGKLPLLLLLPLLLAAVGAGVVFILKRRGQGQAEEPARPDEMPAASDGPPAARSSGAGTASGSANGVPMPSAGAPTA